MSAFQGLQLRRRIVAVSAASRVVFCVPTCVVLRVLFCLQVAALVAAVRMRFVAGRISGFSRYWFEVFLRQA